MKIYKIEAQENCKLEGNTFKIGNFEIEEFYIIASDMIKAINHFNKTHEKYNILSICVYEENPIIVGE